MFVYARKRGGRMIRREEAHLRSVFRRVFVLALAVPLPIALEHCRPIQGAPDDPPEQSDAGDENPVIEDPTSKFDAADPCSPHPYEAGPGVDASDVCGDLVALRCGLPASTVVRDCFFSLADC